MDNLSEAEKKFCEFVETCKTLAETQQRQSAVIDKLADGLLRATTLIDELRTRVGILEIQLKSHCEGGM